MELTSQDWSEYYDITIDKPLHPLFSELEGVLPPGGDAVDLACGVGHGTIFLLERGFHVTAMDAEPRAIDIVRERAGEGAKLTAIATPFESFQVPPADVVIAFFSLFFMPQDRFLAYWQDIVRALKPGGVVAGQFLGDHDDWVERGYAVVSRGEAEELLAPLEAVYFEEAERDGETAFGTPKHWHVFHFVARKPV